MRSSRLFRAVLYIAIWCGCFALIGILWQKAEVLMYGATQPSWPDTFVGIVLATSLTFNIRNMILRQIARMTLGMLNNKMKK